MSPEMALRAAAAVAGFFLKTALALVVCLAVSRLAGSPGRRFGVWATYLFAITLFWLRLLTGLSPAMPAMTKPAGRADPILSAAGALARPDGASHERSHATSHETWNVPPAGHALPKAGYGWPSTVALPPAVALRPASLRVPQRFALPLRAVLSGLGAAYVIALAYILFEYIKKQRKLKWILGFAWPPPGPVQEVFRELAERVGAPRAELLVLSGADSPATFGWVRPVVVAPEECMREGFEGLEAILLHELHHVRRRDYAWNQLALVCRALLVFHPAAWYAASRMQMERELACDLAVVADSAADKADYAECLLRFARLQSAQQPQPWGIDFAGPAGRLKTRIKLILEEPKRNSFGVLALKAAAAAGLLASFLYAAPSVQVLLRYGQRPAPPAGSIAPQAASVRAGRVSRRAGEWTRRLAAPWPAERSFAGSDESAPAMADSAAAPPPPAAAVRGGRAAAPEGSPGPHLLRRSNGPGNPIEVGRAARRVSIPLIDSDSSAEAKTAQASTRRQGLKSAATAAIAIGKVVSDVDHR